MGTINDKLTYLNGTKTAIKNVLIDKGANVSDNDTFRSYAQKIEDKIEELEEVIDEELTTVTVEGTEIDVSDSAEYRGKIEVKGNTEQKQLSGKNLWGGFDLMTGSIVNFRYNKNGTIVANGTNTNNSTLYSMTSSAAVQYVKTLRAGTYTISR